MSTRQPLDTVSAVLHLLEELQLLPPAHLEELKRRRDDTFADARALGRFLVQCGWLTPFQVNRLFQGRGRELVLGSYRLLAPLGQGGMGEVFQARHLLMNRVVALKVIRQDWLGDPVAVRRFRREIQLAAQLNHPNIVVAHDAEQIGDCHFLVMEYCEGPDLGRLIHQAGPLPVGRACAYLQQTALGLQHAWERGIIHRDIKPSNLLVTSTGIKILDMGLARLRQPGAGQETSGTLTERGVILGTPDYMAPEQAQDLERADIRSDLYSLGCTFYFALTGQAPYPGGTAVEKILRHQLEEPQPLQRLRPQVSAEVVAVVRRLMARNPADRYQTPTEAAAAVAPLAQDSATSELPPPPLLPSTVPAAVSLTGSAPSLPPWAAGAPDRGSTPAEPSDQESTVSLAPSWLPRTWRRVRWWLAGAVVLGTLGLLLFLNQRLPEEKVPNVPRQWQRRGLVGAVVDEYVLGVAFSPDSSLLALACGDRSLPPNKPGRVEVWNLTAQRQMAVLADLPGPARCVAFSPDGKTLATGMGDWDQKMPGVVVLWHLPSNQQQARFEATPEGVHGLSFDRSGQVLATGGHDGSVKLWDITRTPPGLRHDLTPRRGKANSVAFARDGQRLVSGAEEATVCWWEAGTGQLLGERTVPRRTFISAAAFADGQLLIAATGVPQELNGPEIYLWHLDRVEPVRVIGLTGMNILCLAMAPDHKTFATGCQGGFVRIWHVDAAEALAVLEPGDPVQAVAFSPDGQLLATAGGWGRKVILWEAAKR